MGPVQSVIGKIQNISDKIASEHLGVGILTFDNGTLGSIQASTTLYPGYPERSEIYGEKGSLILEVSRNLNWNVKDQESLQLPEDKLTNSSGSSNPLAIDNELHKAQITNFAESMLNKNNQPIVSFEEVLKA